MNEEKLCKRINIPFETYESWKDTNPELVKLINYGLQHEEEIINYLKIQLNSIDTIIEIEEFFGKKITEKETLKKNDDVFRDKILEELKIHNVDA